MPCTGRSIRPVWEFRNEIFEIARSAASPSGVVCQFSFQFFLHSNLLLPLSMQYPLSPGCVTKLCRKLGMWPLGIDLLGLMLNRLELLCPKGAHRRRHTLAIPNPVQKAEAPCPWTWGTRVNREVHVTPESLKYHFRPFGRSGAYRHSIPSLCALRLGGEIFRGPGCQSEKEGGALSGFRFRPNSPAMAPDDPVDRGQANTRSGKFGFRMESLKRGE